MHLLELITLTRFAQTPSALHVFGVGHSHVPGLLVANRNQGFGAIVAQNDCALNNARGCLRFGHGPRQFGVHVNGLVQIWKRQLRPALFQRHKTPQHRLSQRAIGRGGGGPLGRGLPLRQAQGFGGAHGVKRHR